MREICFVIFATVSKKTVYISKKKIGGNRAFSIREKKKSHTTLCILKLFTNIVHESSLKNAWFPLIF